MVGNLPFVDIGRSLLHWWEKWQEMQLGINDWRKCVASNNVKVVVPLEKKKRSAVVGFFACSANISLHFIFTETRLWGTRLSDSWRLVTKSLANVRTIRVMSSGRLWNWRIWPRLDFFIEEIGIWEFHGKLDMENCGFWKKCAFRIVNFVKNVISRLWFLCKMWFQNCEFSGKIAF